MFAHKMQDLDNAALDWVHWTCLMLSATKGNSAVDPTLRQTHAAASNVVRNLTFA